MKKYHYLILLMCGCVSKQDTPTISSFSKEALNSLIEKSCGLSYNKKVIINDKEEQKISSFNVETFKKELSFFYELDINQTEFAKTFVRDSISVNENTYLISYKKNQDAKHSLDLIEQSFENNTLTKIEGNFTHETPLFFFKRKISLSINHQKINSYTLDIQQGLIAQDTNHYIVEAQLK